MCGILGVAGRCRDDQFTQMLARLNHRGPDYSAMIQENDIFLGHTRLSIIDLSSNSNQPLWNHSKQACIVFNGEIYNFKSLRSNLTEKGYIFTSNGDAEVILNLYLEYGEQCLEYLNGIFAFAIWDKHKEELFLVRDPLGVKPLYYTQNESGFYFSSELKALLLEPSVSSALNINAIFRSIIFLWSPGEETVLKDILKLEAGHYLRVKNKKIIERKQYYVLPMYNPSNDSVEMIQEHLDKVLHQSISDQMVSDVPVGSFLSGGLDSSLIVSIAKDIGQSLYCFTIDSVKKEDKNDGFENDLPYAVKVAEHLNVPLDILKVNPDIVSSLSHMLYHLDEPLADPAPLNVMLIAEQARKQGIKVLFSGAGGDDLFTGYRRHIAVQAEKWWSWLPYAFRVTLQNTTRKLGKKNPFLRRLSKLFSYISLSDHERLLSYFYWIDPVVVKQLLMPEQRAPLSAQPMQFMLDGLKQRKDQNNLEKMLYLEKRYFLVDHNFNYTDKMSMACGVEVRVPYLDKRVVEFAATIPSHYKQKRKEGKWILKKVAERYLPKSIIHRKKSGFGAPLARWMETDLKPIMEELLSEESLRKRGIFDPQEVQKIIAQNRSGKEYYIYPIFSLMCIELWCRIFIDGREKLSYRKADEQVAAADEVS